MKNPKRVGDKFQSKDLVPGFVVTATVIAVGELRNDAQDVTFKYRNPRTGQTERETKEFR